MTAIQDPQQEYFTRLKLDIEALGYSVYDGFLPPEGYKPPDGKPLYPFVYLGDMRQADVQTKNAVCGFVYPTIHIWHNTPRMRGTVSKMLLDIKTVCRNIEHTANFAWMLTNVSQRILADNTTKTPLLHGVLEIEAKFS